MRILIFTVSVLVFILVACGGALHLSQNQYNAVENPVFRAEKIDKYQLRNMPVGDPVFLDDRHSAWVSAQGEVLIFDHEKNKEVRHFSGKNDVSEMSYPGGSSFYWIEEEQNEHHLTRFGFTLDDELWRERCQPTVVKPVVADSVVVVAGMNGQVVARDTANGRERWKTSLQERVFVQPVQFGTDILVLTDEGNLYAIHHASGEIRWKEPFRRTILSQTLDAGSLYLGGFDGGMIRYDIVDRSIRWTVKTAHQVRNAPLIQDGRVIWVNSGGEVLTIDQQTGEHTQLVDLSTPVAGSPAVTEQGYLIAGIDNTLYHVDFSDGGFLNSIEFEGRLRSSPFYFRDHWYVTMEDRWIYALR